MLLSSGMGNAKQSSDARPQESSEASPEEGVTAMGFLSRLMVVVGLSFGLTLLLMVAMYEPEALPATVSQSVTAATPSGVPAPGMAAAIR